MCLIIAPIVIELELELVVVVGVCDPPPYVGFRLDFEQRLLDVPFHELWQLRGCKQRQWYLLEALHHPVPHNDSGTTGTSVGKQEEH
jgi:hypothetical protein